MSKQLLLIFLIMSALIYSCVNDPKAESEGNADTLNINQTLSKVPEKAVEKKKKADKLKASETETQIITSNLKTKYKLRKYNHVGEFFRRITWPATKLCVENNVPPAAVLSIAGLESGWNKGYVGRITGNILSLGTRKGDDELPALRLPRLKSTKQILFDSLVIIKYSNDDLKWENRPESLKKDYRPPSIAGRPYQLAYFKYHPEAKAKAQVENIHDFLTIFISRNSRIAVYREARHLMDSLVDLHGKEILFDHATALTFINTIGGRPNSFNFRETWPKKVEYIMNNAGLVELTGQMYLDQKDFDEVW